jgi:hypothetical protein
VSRFAVILAMFLAIGAAVAVCAPAAGLGMFLAMGLGIGAIGTGAVAYRRRTDPGARRLWGTAAIAVGALALMLAAVRYGLALAAVEHLETLLGA